MFPSPTAPIRVAPGAVPPWESGQDQAFRAGPSVNWHQDSAALAVSFLGYKCDTQFHVTENVTRLTPERSRLCSLCSDTNRDAGQALRTAAWGAWGAPGPPTKHPTATARGGVLPPRHLPPSGWGVSAVLTPSDSPAAELPQPTPAGVLPGGQHGSGVTPGTRPVQSGMSPGVFAAGTRAPGAPVVMAVRRQEHDRPPSRARAPWVTRRPPHVHSSPR